MGYGLYRSYNGIDNTNTLFENKIGSISKSLDEYNRNLSNINTKLKSNDLLIEELKTLVVNSQKDEKEDQYQSQINDLKILNKKLEKKINNINDNFIIKDNLELSFNKQINSKQVYDLKKIILLKFKNGEKISDEINLLESISKNTDKYIFEKLYIFEMQNFLGMNNLEKEFDTSVKKFIRFNLLSDQNLILNFILNFVSVKPNNIEKYEIEEMNIIMRAKEYMQIEDLNKSLKQILLLSNNDKFFKNWINQTKMYLEFSSELKKVS